MRTTLEQGHWGTNVDWTLFQTNEMPDHAFVSAVFCLAVYDSDIVLMRARRGWGMLGGHVESGESPLQALTRECLEEGGFKPIDPQIYAVREIVSRQPTPHPTPGMEYPFPLSHMVYYWARTDQVLRPYTGEEVLDSKTFRLDTIKDMGLRDQSLIELGWAAATEK